MMVQSLDAQYVVVENLFGVLPFLKILSGNGLAGNKIMASITYQDGYQSGYEDAWLGKLNRPKPKFSKALFNAKYVDEFVKGYRHGYNYGLLQERKNWTNQRSGFER